MGKNEKVERMLKIGMQYFAEPGEGKDKPEDNDGNSSPDDNNGDNGKPEDKPEKTFSQEQVNKMMAREKNQGRNSVFSELGIDPKNEEQINKLKEFIESQKTDTQKAVETELKANKELDEANKKLKIAEAKAEAMMMGVKSQYVEDAITIVLSKLSNDDTRDIKSVLSEFKTKYPVWFEDEEGKGSKGTGSSLKGQGKKSEGSGNEKSGLGARLGAQRKTQKPKNTFWS